MRPVRINVKKEIRHKTFKSKCLFSSLSGWPYKPLHTRMLFDHVLYVLNVQVFISGLFNLYNMTTCLTATCYIIVRVNNEGLVILHVLEVCKETKRTMAN